MRSLPSLVALVALLGAVLPACGPEEERILASKFLPIIGGTVDTNPAHAGVVYLSFTISAGPGAACTGSLISPNFVLTAGHCCVDEDGVTPISTSGYTVNFGASVGHFTDSRTVKMLHEHPQYTLESNGSTLNDLCVVELTSAAPASVTPLPYLPVSLGLKSSDVGQSLEFVGFGLTNANNQYSGGTRMTVKIPLGVICESSSGCSFGANIHDIGFGESPGGICFGDSGGPAFITRNGTQYVAGDSSYVGSNCQTFGVSTNVGDFESFIDGVVGQANGAACSTASQCLSKNCVNSVCCATSSCPACNICNNNASLPGTCHSAPDSTACSDGNACTTGDQCLSGICQPGSPLNCTSTNPCQVGSCNQTSGCIQTPVANGTSCSDNNLCNGQETCQNGVCQAGTPLDCKDNNPCTNDVCDSQNGCLHQNLADGTDCGGGVCGQATCSGGQCQNSNPTICDDKDPCTTDWCDPQSGCAHQWLPDGYQCGDCKMCQAHACVDVPDCSSGGCGCASRGGAGGEGAGAALLLLILIGLARVRLGAR